MLLFVAFVFFTPSSLASNSNEFERQACIARTKDICSSINPNGLIDQALQMKMIQCEQDLEARGIKCDKILAQNQEKRRCNATQFCDPEDNSEILKNCGLSFVIPFWNALWGPIDLGITVLSSLGKSLWLCSTKKNCGTPELSSEQQAQLLEAQQNFSNRLAADEIKEEAELCETTRSKFGCPLPEISCRQWDQLLLKSSLDVNGETISVHSINNKDGFNKNNFCRRAAESLNAKRDDLKNSSARIAAEAMKLWFQDYMQSFECYQPRYAAEQICGLTGEVVTAATFSALFLKAMQWAREGKSVQEIAKLLKRDKLDSPHVATASIKQRYGDLLDRFDGNHEELASAIQKLEEKGVAKDKIRNRLRELTENPKLCTIN